MKTGIKRAVAVVAGAGAALAPVLAPGTASAKAAPRTVYVSLEGGSSAADTSCATAGYSDINAAIAAVATRGTVTVCAGIYDQNPVVNRTVTLQGQPSAVVVINLGVEGPGIQVTADSATVRGLTLENGYSGIEVNGNHDTITGNTLAGMAAHPGVGILVSGSHALVADNTISDVFGFGIAVQDLYGYDPNYEPGQPPAAYNRVTGNRVEGTASAGIVLQSFAGNGGVYRNVVSDNVVENAASPEQNCQDGPGVLLGSFDWPYMVTRCPDSAPTVARKAPAAGGGVHDNTVQRNTINENGWPGVTVLGATEGSAQDMNGNVVTANSIGTNNLQGINLSFLPAVVPPLAHTGILVASPTPLSIKLTGNVISDNVYGIWKNSTVQAPSAAQANRFVNVTAPVYTFPGS